MSRSPHLEFIRDTWHGVFYFPTIDEKGHATYRRKRISLAVKGKEHKRRAQKAFTQLERELLIERKTSEQIVSKTDTIGDLAELYGRAMRLEVRSRTEEIYRSAISRFVEMWGEIQCSEISALHIERFRETLRMKYSIASANMYFRAVKTMFSYGVRVGIIAHNPAVGVRQYRPEPKGFPPYITMDEYRRVEDYFLEKMKRKRYADDARRQLAVLSLAMYAGLRRAEAQHLRWQNVDLEKREIRIAISDSFVTKTGKERTVPITGRLLLILKQLTREGEYVIPGKEAPVTDRSYATKVWDKVRSELGFSISYHGLRHSFATWLSSQPGVSLKTVSDILGHSDIKTTMIYAHVQKSDLDRIKEL